MTLNYTQIFDEILKSKFKELVQSGHATGGVALAALKRTIGSRRCISRFFLAT